MSLPAWGAWIEMLVFLIKLCCSAGRSPHGERGLKLQRAAGFRESESRSPHGERGLKYHNVVKVPRGFMSLPAWGAWIEIQFQTLTRRSVAGRSPHGERGLKSRWNRGDKPSTESLPAWGAWIEIMAMTACYTVSRSLPAWGAWIEILIPFCTIAAG